MTRRDLDGLPHGPLNIVVGPPDHQVFSNLSPEVRSTLPIESLTGYGESVPPVDASGNMPPVSFSLQGQRVPLTSDDSLLLEMLANGMSNKDMSDSTGLPRRALELHIEDLRRRLGGDNMDRAGMVTMGMILGAIPAPEPDHPLRERPKTPMIQLGVFVCLGYGNRSIARILGKREDGIANRVMRMNRRLGYIPSREATFPYFLRAGLFRILPPNLVTLNPESVDKV